MTDLLLALAVLLCAVVTVVWRRTERVVARQRIQLRHRAAVIARLRADLVAATAAAHLTPDEPLPPHLLADLHALPTADRPGDTR